MAVGMCQGQIGGWWRSVWVDELWWCLVAVSEWWILLWFSLSCRLSCHLKGFSNGVCGFSVGV